jgi:phospholipase C
VKYIERNLQLSTITNRSRDNLPNPITHQDTPYLPVNSPAASDLFDLFDFDRHHHEQDHNRDDDDGPRHANDDSDGGKG